MGKTYLGINGIAKDIRNIYLGVNGVARTVSKIYLGVNGTAREVYPNKNSLVLFANGEFKQSGDKIISGQGSPSCGIDSDGNLYVSGDKSMSGSGGYCANNAVNTNLSPYSKVTMTFCATGSNNSNIGFFFGSGAYFVYLYRLPGSSASYEAIQMDTWYTRTYTIPSAVRSWSTVFFMHILTNTTATTTYKIKYLELSDS